MKKLTVFFGLCLLIISCKDKEVKKEPVKEQPKEEVVTPKVNQEPPKPILVFKVQIGAYTKQNTRLASVMNVQEVKENRLFKYRLGEFTTYKQARTYRRKLLRTYPDAFVQAVKNNQPIAIKEALK